LVYKNSPRLPNGLTSIA